ncbi:TPA: DUF4054 domain-containing protein [Pseudomonas aeruginosa]
MFVCEDEFGDAYNVALALMAAHIMASPGGYSDNGSTSSGRILSRKEGDLAIWIGPYISRHFLSLYPLLVRRRRYSRGERYPSALCGCHSL